MNLVLLFKLLTFLALMLLFLRNFRGGRPPTPMHPCPADDAFLLRKRRSKQKSLGF
jgi:hypothetical protein